MKISLRYKAALFIALTEFALLGLLVLTNLYQTRSDLEEQLRQRAHATAELVAASATEPVLSSDLAQIRNLLAGVVHKHQVRYAAVTDHRERLLAEAGQRAEPASVVEVVHPISVADTLFGRVTLQVARAETEAALAKTTRSNLIIAGLAMGLVAFISLTLGWFLTRNLAALARGVEAVRQGDYAARVGLRSRDEVGDLAAGFNDMATQLERTVSDLARSQQRFRDLADNTSDWLWETDAEGRYTYVSKSVEFLLGYAPESLLGRRIFELMTAEDAVRLERLFQLAREGRQPFYGFEYHATGRGGASVVLEANGIPLLDDAGMLLGYRGISRDITRRKVDESRIVYLAEHDPLTGLLSRQKFLEALDDELKLAAYTERPFAVLFIDLDDFKLINDTHGHRVGDTLLRAAADLLARLAGEGNSLARLG
ncbi:MAG: diguanylate cyclase, partial [Pseudomonadota bacterium]